MNRNNRDKNEKTSYIFTRETMGMTLLLFCAIVLVMLFTGDVVFSVAGRAICTFMYGTFGYGSYLVLAFLSYCGVWLAFDKKIRFPRIPVLCGALTLYIFFMLFHAVTTASYELNGYGSYLAQCYLSAAGGWAGYTFGGVLSGLLVYPVMTLGGAVGAYIVFSVLTLLFGYLTYLTIRRTLHPQNSANPVRAQTAVADSTSLPQPQPTNVHSAVAADHLYAVTQENEIVDTRVQSQPVAPDPVMEREEEDRFSQKNLGRKILFENGEFAAESYRRNMIFNEDSYFNHPVRNDEDYLRSFSDGSKKTSQSYTNSYQEEVMRQPSTNIPTNYVYGEKPVVDLGGFEQAQESVYQAPVEPTEPVSAEPEFTPAYDENVLDDYSQSIRDDNYVEEEEEPLLFDEQTEEPPVTSTRAGFGDGFRPAESNDEPTTSKIEPEEVVRRNETKKDTTPDFRNLFGADSARGDRRIEPDVSRLSSRGERSNANLLDEDDGDTEDVFAVPPERVDRIRPIENESLRRSEELPKQEEKKSQTSLTPSSVPVPTPAPKQEPAPEPVAEEKPKHVWKKYVHPSLDLLKDYSEFSNVNTNEIESNKRTIVETLGQFKIGCEVANVTIGPAITRYDIIIEDKLNIKRSLSYREAISMALMKDNVNAYLNYTKGALSIEVPNNKRTTVGLKSILTSQKYINAKQNSLTFALGKNVEGEVVCPDITKMPHLLVAGTTGSGKSICLSSLLISLLYKYGPEELRLILVDPKQVEFISYDKLPHLMINEIIYDVDKALKALNWAIKEMERRYSLFKEMTEKGTATKNLDEYNSHLPEGEEKLPKIVIILDEFGDLMLQAKKEIEGKIIKLVQKARACGIHLILATQRPSVDCITGLIKSNLPTRIGFKVNSFDDSRTIFDIGGAEKLLGMGDMYFRSTENPDLARIQGCFVDTPEVQRVTDFIKANNETYFDQSVSDFINTVEQPEASASAPSEGGEDGAETKIDDTFIKALKYCVTSNQASVSMIQRRFPVGYIKACKIIDWMEDMNYITKSEGSKPRKVLLSKDEFVNTYGDIDD